MAENCAQLGNDDDRLFQRTHREMATSLHPIPMTDQYTYKAALCIAYWHLLEHILRVL